MHDYNANLSELLLPEYGRNVQRMIDFCMTIEERAERTRCAYSIISTMRNVKPKEAKEQLEEQKLWDHLMIMSGFRLEIDFPFEVVSQELLLSPPERVAYRDVRENRFRTYGLYVRQLVEQCREMEDGDARLQLIRLIASYMRMTQDSGDDSRILNDLFEMSNGEINVDPEQFRIFTSPRVPTASPLSAPAGKRFKGGQGANYQRRKSDKQ